MDIFMKLNILLSSGIIGAGVLAARVTCQAQVYANGLYSMGTSYYEICSTALPCRPYKYKMTEINWLEDKNGLMLNPITHTNEPGDVSRQTIEVEYGSEHYYLPLDSGVVTPFVSSNDRHVPISKGSGDLGTIVTEYATHRGARPTTNTLPVVQANWIHGSQANEDFIVLDGNHFTQIQDLIERAYGKQDGTIRSDAGVNGHSITYTPTQISIVLNVTTTWDPKTIVSIIGKQKP
jgi:hypothetical protein